ncbi:MAG: TIGR04222 domain-containing membrane protein [Novosphingobium sp.]|nr:TIGR04222 domain-containing membrane protein [Novosphingobium sp.]
MGLGVFDLTGGQFLILYGVLFVLTVVAGLVIPRWLKPEGSPGAVTDPEEIAYLAGGRQRFNDMVVAQALSAGAITLGNKEFHVADTSVRLSPTAARLVSIPSPFAWSAVGDALLADAQRIEARLTRAGLLMEKPVAAQMRFWQASPYLALLVFGAIKLEVGLSRGKPVVLLIAFMVATAIAGIIRFAKVDRRTKQGAIVLDGAKSDADRLSRAPMKEETGMAVALFGTSVLVGSAFGDFHRFRSSADGGGFADTSGCSSDGGDSGCGGGGGCGGCGGD